MELWIMIIFVAYSMTAIQTGIYLLIRGEIKPKGRVDEDIFFFHFIIFLGSIFFLKNTKIPFPQKTKNPTKNKNHI